ncbi:hypothetical protein BOX15_Mlig001191g8, partial [Macrostomum lignano]
CAQLLSGLCSAAVWPVLSCCLACAQLLMFNVYSYIFNLLSYSLIYPATF